MSFTPNAALERRRCRRRAKARCLPARNACSTAQMPGSLRSASPQRLASTHTDCVHSEGRSLLERQMNATPGQVNPTILSANRRILIVQFYLDLECRAFRTRVDLCDCQRPFDHGDHTEARFPFLEALDKKLLTLLIHRHDEIDLYFHRRGESPTVLVLDITERSRQWRVGRHG